MEEIIKKYTNGEVTIVWKPAACIHSTICFGDLPTVFSPRKRPWINAHGASTEEIIEVIKRCPTTALSYYMNNEAEEPGEIRETDAENIVQIMKNGPLLVFGNILVKDGQGNETKKSNVTSFCRCGLSKTNPYCDGTHIKKGFKG
jgi:uncharacterized Fe-S cluster protein YjdI